MSSRDPEDELLERLNATEKARKTRAMAIGATVAVLCVGGFGLAVEFKDTLFRPELDVESGEENVLEDTNDPQCRAFIADITLIGKDYVELEPKLDDLLGSDQAKIEGLTEEVEVLKSRIQAARETSTEANLRFDNSRTEVHEWFRYIDNELTLLQRVGRDRIGEMSAQQPDAGTVVEDGVPNTSEKPMPERLSGATLAANEAFQKFRVWHTGGLHPCGAADEGESPWAPEEAPKETPEAK